MRHPVLNQPGIDFEQLIPVTVHGDGAQIYRDDDNFIYSFGSAFGSRGAIQDVLAIKFPVAIIPERWMQDYQVSDPNIKKYVMCFLNLMPFANINFDNAEPIQPAQVRTAVNETIAQLVAWSLGFAAEGKAPCIGFEGEQFDKGSYRFSMRGQELSKGWK